MIGYNSTKTALAGDFFGKIVGWVGPDFREGGVIVGHDGQFADSHALGHRGDDLVYQFSAHWPDASNPEDLA